MANFMILLKKNLVEMIRNKRIIIFSAVFVALSLISAFSAKYLPVLLDFLLSELGEGMGNELFLFEGTVADSYIQLISNFGEIAILLVSIMFAGTIVKEKNKGTYYSLKMNGVKDHQIVLSHFVSQVILVGVSYLVSVAIFVLLNILLFRQIMGLRGCVVLTYMFLLLLVTICFSLFASCLCKKSGKAYLLVILSYFVVTFMEIIPYLNKVNPIHLLTISTNLMYIEEYSLSEHLITSFSTIGICVGLITLSLFLVKNRINNKKVLNNDNRERI